MVLAADEQERQAGRLPASTSRKVMRAPAAIIVLVAASSQRLSAAHLLPSGANGRNRHKKLSQAKTREELLNEERERGLRVCVCVRHASGSYVEGAFTQAVVWRAESRVPAELGRSERAASQQGAGQQGPPEVWGFLSLSEQQQRQQPGSRCRTSPAEAAVGHASTVHPRHPRTHQGKWRCSDSDAAKTAACSRHVNLLLLIVDAACRAGVSTGDWRHGAGF